jgi:hypothetical protein
MSLHALFTGTLYLPDKALSSATSPVMLSDGRTVAQVQWHFWTARGKFEVLDAQGRVIAEGGSQGLTARRYVVTTPDGRTVVEIKLGVWRPINSSTITLSTGSSLSVRQTTIWSDRNFEFFSNGRPVGRITPTTGLFTFRPDSYAFELSVPVMSAVEAISLAQALRAIVRAARSSNSS